MSLQAALTAIALALPLPWAHEEPQQARAERVTVIADAVTFEAYEPVPGWDAVQSAAVALTIVWYESERFRLGVHDGTIRGDRGASICVAQAQDGPWLTRAEWEALAGTDEAATGRCVAYAFRVLRHHARRCRVREWSRDSVARLAAAYGTGYSCRADLKFAQERTRTALRLEGELRAIVEAHSEVVALALLPPS